ncbi:hypothetical protein BR63_17135 [Thermanaerosceptrum fracticalcis]|uniref:Uncharacterized protein n=1 Tax=Thermanaerosceptrum fracticalcis TaxID=1712410 RepID=A0A7G6E6X7_THEFR|nr:hypothetical protein [Thermanaerosceptrum fracticalcis]QNB47831.1 hypothetical protein BR63_17135 [Thermanaerosceptrum fracticalcis]
MEKNGNNIEYLISRYLLKKLLAEGFITDVGVNQKVYHRDNLKIDHLPRR